MAGINAEKEQCQAAGQALADEGTAALDDEAAEKVKRQKAQGERERQEKELGKQHERELSTREGLKSWEDAYAKALAVRLLLCRCTPQCSCSACSPVVLPVVHALPQCSCSACSRARGAPPLPLVLVAAAHTKPPKACCSSACMSKL